MNYKKVSIFLSVFCCIIIICMGTVLFSLYSPIQAHSAEKNGKLVNSAEENRQLQLQMSKINETMDDFRSNIAELERNGSKLEETMDEFRSNIAELERNGSKLEGKLVNSAEENRQLQLQMSKINETMDDFRSNIAELERNGSKLEENLLETRELKKVVESGGNLDCKDLLEAGNTEDGVYSILIRWLPVHVLCDMVGGGFTVFQHRFNGSVNFRRNFQNYTRGFGDPNNEYWMGLENIHQMTSIGQWMLQIDLEAFDGETRNAQYKDFKVHSGSRYELAVGAYSGTAGDSLSYHNGQAFSTYDMDRDGLADGHCASDGSHNGAWWWRNCGYSNLNSYSYNDTGYQRGMYWAHFKGPVTPMKMTMMKMIKV